MMGNPWWWTHPEPSEYESTKELAQSVNLLLTQGIAAIERLCSLGESLTRLVSKIEHMEAIRKDMARQEALKKEGLKVG